MAVQSAGHIFATKKLILTLEDEKSHFKFFPLHEFNAIEYDFEAV
jgi:hypothetical protein